MKLGPKPGSKREPLVSRNGLPLDEQNQAAQLAYILNRPNPRVIARQSDYTTPLHLAVTLGQEDSIKNLLEWAPYLGLDYVNAQSCTRETPLHFSLHNASTTVTELLLEYGANIEAVDYFGRTPLHTATRLGDLNQARLLLDCGADANKKDGYVQLAYDVIGHSSLTTLPEPEVIEIQKLLWERMPAGSNVGYNISNRRRLGPGERMELQ